MIRYSTKQFDNIEMLERFDEDISKWFFEKYPSFTPPQRLSIPLIDRRENLLISSPTGTGKTLTAFLSIINSLYKLAKKGELKNRIYCIYVSPLKALARDIQKNLLEPLEEIYDLAENGTVGRSDPDASTDEGPEASNPERIRVSVRTGDTSAQDKQKMSRTAPHILITTPESLSIALSTSKFVNKLKYTEYVIVDEIHDLASSKRGTLLSLSLERLQYLVKDDLTRIGLSATQSPIELIAGFLVGRKEGKLRDVTIIEYKGSRNFDIEVLTAFSSLNQPYNDRLKNAVGMIGDLIGKYGSTIVFANTRNMTEKISHLLKEGGMDAIATHHGSLGKETRHRIEDKLKEGELKAVVTSSSLELGIDVGHINLVVQLGSPKSTARGLQRVGRAGHTMGMVSRGRFIALEMDELLECCTIASNIQRSRMDDITIPNMCLDVLSQSVIGMSLEGNLTDREAYNIVTGSTPYKDISWEEFENILKYISRDDLIKYRMYPKIRYDEESGNIGSKQLARMIYFLNVGTIPPQMEYKVRRAEDGSYIGTLSDTFVEKLTKNDVFLLGGRSYQFIKTVGSAVYVKHAGGITPTLPSWSGEFFSRTTDLSGDLGSFLSTLEASLLEKGFDRRILKKVSIPESEIGKKHIHLFGEIFDRDILDTLQSRYSLSQKGAKLLLEHVFLQLVHGRVVPSGWKILVEGYIDNMRTKNIIIHSVFGRKVNEPIARALASVIVDRYGGRVKYSIHDSGMMLTLEDVSYFELYEVFNMVHSENIEPILRQELRKSDLFKRRFLHCANRGFCILKNYKGYEISIRKQQRHAMDILSDVPTKILESMPVYREAYNEVLNQYMDLGVTKNVLRNIARGKIKIYVRNYSTRPTVFSHSLVVSSLTDISSLASKTMVFKQLGGELFEEIIGYGSSRGVDGIKIQFSREMLDEHFKRDASFYKDLKKYQRKAKADYTSIRDRIESGALGSSSAPISRVEMIKQIIIDFLHNFGPFTRRELEAHLSFAVKRINLQSVLSELEKEADVIRHRIIKDDKHYYYIFRRDFRSLRLKTGGNSVLTSEEFKGFAYDKFFDNSREFNELLAEGDLIGSPLDIFQQSKRFTKSKWLQGIKDGELLQARFIRSKMYFISRERISEFVWLRRTSPLSAVEQTLLQYIMDNPGSKRSKIYKECTINRAQIYEALYRLEKNLWIARSHLPSADMESAVGFVYIPNEDFDSIFFKAGEEYTKFDPTVYRDEVKALVRESHERIVLYLLGNFGPMTKSTLQEHAWLFGQDLDGILGELISAERVKQVFVENPYPTDMYVTAEDLDKIMEIKEGEGRQTTFSAIISDTHPFFHLVMHKAFLRFTGVWSHILVEGNEPLLAFKMERKRDHLRIVNVELASDPSEMQFYPVEGFAGRIPEDSDETRRILKLFVAELEEVLKFYSNFDIDVIKIEAVGERPVEQLVEKKNWIIDAFADLEVVVLEGNLVMGNLFLKSHSFDEVLKYVLLKQHLHRDNQFSNPGDLIKTFGTVSSTPEVRLRTCEDSITINAYAKNYDLVKAILVPARQMYTTRDMIGLYKVALKRRISPTAKYLLDVIPKGFVVSDKKWFERTSMGRSVYLEKKKELIDALYVVKDAKNSFTLVEDTPNINKGEARRQCIMNIFCNFGVFTLPRLRQYVGPEFSLEELREIVNKLVSKGFLIKGYLLRDSKEIHYMLKEDAELIGEVQTYRKFILPPKDPMWYYLQEDIVKRYGKGDWYVIIKGGEMVAAYKGKEGEETFNVEQYVGEERYQFMVERWIWRKGLDVVGL